MIFLSRLWITGYRSYEIGAFNEQDPKVTVVKMAIKSALEQAINDGVDWIISGGQLGVEQWSLQVAADLKKQYPDEFKTAMMLPFQNFGNQWGETNQAILTHTKLQIDFQATVSNQEYQSPKQLRNYQEFMLSHTDEAILIYDLESPGKPKYDYEAILGYNETHSYPYQLITFDDLQETAEEYQEMLNNGLQDS